MASGKALLKPAALTAAAFGSGLFLTLLFAPFNLWPLAWIWFVPLLLAVHSVRTRLAATLLGLLTGLVFWLTCVPWIVHVIMEHGFLSYPLAVLGLLVLATYLSLFTATVMFLLKGALRRFGPTAFFLAPFLWVSAELIVTHFLTGFPWNLLGYSQIGFLPVDDPCRFRVRDLGGGPHSRAPGFLLPAELTSELERSR